MNAQKFTQKSLDAINKASGLVTEYGNAEIGQEHLLTTLLTQENGLTAQLITKIGLDAGAMTADAKRAVEKLPHVSGQSAQYITADLQKTLNAAEHTAERMKAEFVSVDHLFHALIDTVGGAVRQLFPK